MEAYGGPAQPSPTIRRADDNVAHRDVAICASRFFAVAIGQDHRFQNWKYPQAEPSRGPPDLL
jgi:hypothetical protein